MSVRFLSLVLVLAGCNNALEASVPSDLQLGDWLDEDLEVSPVIFFGEEPAAEHHRAVVALFDHDGQGASGAPFCTGTLIAPDVVLTAAHCLDVAPGRAPRFETMSALDLAIYVGDEPRLDLASNDFDVVETVIHPGYNRRSLLNDIALVRLAVPVLGVDPVLPLPDALGFTAADRNQIVEFSGFGVTENDDFGYKLAVHAALAGPGCALNACPDRGDRPTQASYRQASGGPCSGDSGGPMFVLRGQEVFVGGVTSFGDARCRSYGVSTRVDAFEDFIAGF